MTSLLLLTLATAAPELDVQVNNNPALSTQLVSDAKQQTWDIKNEPGIRVRGRGFDDGRTPLSAVVAGKQVGVTQVEIKGGAFDHTFPLAKPLSSVPFVDVSVGKAYREKVPVRLRRLHGRVTRFDGMPVKNPIVDAKVETVLGDADGRYSILVSGPRRSVAVFDQGYTRTSLEPWVYGVDLPADLELNPRMDRMEVEALHVWRTYVAIHAFFVPHSLGRNLAVRGKGLKGEAEAAMDPEAWPRLTQKDVQVFVGDQKVEIASFTEMKESMTIQGKTGSRWVYVVSVPRVDLQGKVVRVEIQHRFNDGKGEVLERGEGQWLGFLRKE
jgi:hypothetical protein